MLENYFEDAQATLARVFDVNSTISITNFNSQIANQVIVSACNIEHYGSEDCDRSNILINLQYLAYDFKADFLGTQITKNMQLLVLCPEADVLWTYNMKNKVWNGVYPSTVAIDLATSEVYLLFVSSWGVELKHFATMGTDKLKVFLETFKETAPYQIYIKPEAMFAVLDGAEGYNHLLRNLYIEFNSAVPYKVMLDTEETYSLGSMEM